jgi:hypothetical protein
VADQDERQNETSATEDEAATTTDTAGQRGTASTEDKGQGQGQGQQPERAMFTAAQQEYLNKLLADERRTSERRFRESDEFKSLKARAQRADELEGQGRQVEEDLSAQLAKAKAERAAALASAENALMKAFFTSELGRRGVPGERHQDAFLLADRSDIKVNLNDQTVTGIEEAVQSLIETRPYLVGAGVAPQQTQAPRPAPKLNGGATGAPQTDEARIAQAMQELAARGVGRV